MRIATICPACADDESIYVSANKYFVPADRVPWTTHPAKGLAVIDLTCKKGHTFSLKLQNLSFELLFETALLAYNDEYYRESVVSAASALERAMEFYIRYATKDTLDIDEVLKNIKNNTQREIGAFFALYALKEGRSFYTGKLKFNERENFRNRCVHQGLFPNPEDALDYLEFVYERIHKIVDSIRNGIKPQNFTGWVISLMEEGWKSKNPCSIMMAPTAFHATLSHITPEQHLPFDQQLERARIAREDVIRKRYL